MNKFEPVPVSRMPYYEAGMWLCANCSLDKVTIINMRDTIIPSVRRSGFYTEIEVAEAVALFERRVKAIEVMA